MGWFANAIRKSCPGNFQLKRKSPTTETVVGKMVLRGTDRIWIYCAFTHQLGTGGCALRSGVTPGVYLGSVGFLFFPSPTTQMGAVPSRTFANQKSSLAKITTPLEIKHIAAAGLKLPRCPLCARMFLGNVRNAVGRWEPSRLRPHLG